MAINAATQWQIISGSAAGNVNGGGFNTANANFLTDLTTDANTANTASPVISSASYNFAAGDVSAWIYIKSGTNWTPGFYIVASVASNKATLNAAIGAGYQLNSTYNYWFPNTVVGIATVGTPTAGTFGVDYSHTATARIAGVADFTVTGTGNILISATAGFTRVMVGNIFHQTTSGTGGFGFLGWYEIVNYTNATTVTIDRQSSSATSVNTTGYVGGSMSLNSTIDDSFLEGGAPGNIYWYKGNLTLGQAVNIALAGSSSAPINHIGYASIPGDNPTPFGLSSNAPLIDTLAFGFILGATHFIQYMIFTGTGTATLGMGAGNIGRYIKVLNTSLTTAQIAIGGSGNTHLWNFEAVSIKGIAVTILSGTGGKILYGYLHDSNTGVQNVQNNAQISGCLITNNLIGLDLQSSNALVIDHCTVHGFNTPIAASTGVAMNPTNALSLFNNNIIDGYATLISQTTAQIITNKGQYNDWYNYTTLATRYTIDPTDLVGVDPQYIDVSEVSGSSATSSGSVITMSGSPDLSTVQDNISYIRVVSATTALASSYLITAHNNGAHTVTVSPAIGTGTAITWIIPLGHNLQPGNNVKGMGFPGQFQGSTTISYTNQGAIQRAVNNGTAGGSYVFSG